MGLTKDKLLTERYASGGGNAEAKFCPLVT